MTSGVKNWDDVVLDDQFGDGLGGFNVPKNPVLNPASHVPKNNVPKSSVVAASALATGVRANQVVSPAVVNPIDATNKTPLKKTWKDIDTDQEFLKSKKIREKVELLVKQGLLKNFPHGRPFFMHNHRLMVLANVGGVEVPFYISSGENPKKNVVPGQWYPFFGLAKDGWLIKSSMYGGIGKCYNIEVLQNIKRILDSLDLDRILKDFSAKKLGKSGPDLLRLQDSLESATGYHNLKDCNEETAKLNIPKLTVTTINSPYRAIESSSFIGNKIQEINALNS